MAVKIKLKRLGKTRNPQYRIVVADSRTARGGRSIEEIGIYQPRQEPSLIRVDTDRVQYWLGVGAQPTEPVLAILKVTGDWQKFKGLPGAEGTLRVAGVKADRRTVFEAAVKSADEVGQVRKTIKPQAEAKAPAKAVAEPAPAAAPEAAPTAKVPAATGAAAADPAATEPTAATGPAATVTDEPAEPVDGTAAPSA